MGQINRRYIILLFVPFLFSSCALLVNTKRQDVELRCNNSLTLTKFSDSTATVYIQGGQKMYNIRRSEKPLVLQFRLHDSSIVDYALKSRLSPIYILGNLPLGLTGYVVDLFFKNYLRYTPVNYFRYDTLTKKVVRKRFLLQDKSYLSTGIALNILNAWHTSMYNPGGVTPVGISLQAGYFFKRNRSLRFEAGGAYTTAPRRDRGARNLERYGDQQSIVDIYSNAYWLALSYRYHINRLAISSGISFSSTKVYYRHYNIIRWDTIRSGDTVSFRYLNYDPEKRGLQTLNNLGLLVNVDYALSKHISAGINWHIFAGDLNHHAKGIYASHFFNFYVALKAPDLKLHKQKTVYEYN